ncbi:MAG: adenylate/guanylate cyclase domain-containing protein [Pseudomonadota bacterium]
MRARLRLYSGLILFTYVVGHLASHAFGIVSLKAMNGTLAYLATLWWTPVGQVALFGALFVHLGCALYAIYLRDSLRMPGWEAAQLILGLLIPLQLIGHIVGTRVVFLIYGVASDYSYMLAIFWIAAPVFGVLQGVLLIVAWTHGCIGIYAWLVVKPWFSRNASILLAIAAVVPALAMAGYVSAGVEVRATYGDQDALSALFASKKFTPEAGAFITTWMPRLSIGYLALVGLAFLARGIRLYLRKNRIRVRYPDGREVDVPPGASLLGTSQAHDIPHASVCGGRGRCSTCRVLIVSGIEDLPPAEPGEEKVLRRVGAPPMVRLACQTRPTANVEIVPLLPATATASDGFAKASYTSGQEREIAILFSDLRGFTGLTEQKLPYDVVFLLNRYFSVMGEAIEQAGGRLDKFIGDGVMALFGVESGADEGCRRALKAATGMAAALNQLNESLVNDLKEPLRMGIGIHIGPAIVGDMGYGPVKGLTAVGDAVNTASRLEAMTKSYGAQLVISAEVARRAGVSEAGFERVQADIRGRMESLPVLVLKDIGALADKVAQVEKVS